MFYSLIKIYARLAIKIYCKQIVVNKPEVLKLKGPVLFAANHPNSFLDGIILTTLFDGALYSLARGDAFPNKPISFILKNLKLLPVYRTSEGVHNLGSNYKTFAACHDVFKKGGSVLIFSEAACINEWHLRPLRKGTARLAESSWEQNIDLKVIPLGFNYDSFKSFGKIIHLNFGEPLLQSSLLENDSSGKRFNDFNEQLQLQLHPLVYEANSPDEAQKFFPIIADAIKTALLFIPGIIGWLLHAPLFFLFQLVTKIFFKKSDHYDSVLTGLLLISYPIYLFLFILTLWNWLGYLSLFTVIIMPFTAWCWLQVKHLFNRYGS